MDSKLKICIAIPVYNEKELIYDSIKVIASYIENLTLTSTLLIIDDGSDYQTKEQISKALNETTRIIIHSVCHQRNKGYGAAVKTAIDFAVKNSHDYIIFMDSDLTNHPKYLCKFINKINEGYEYVKASRYVPKGNTVGVPFSRRWVSRIGNYIAKHISRVPVNDITNGFRAAKINLLASCQLQENDFSIIIEEFKMMSARTKLICEIPYVLTTREKGVSTFPYKISTCIKYLKILRH
jgi:dolichol-phosphate mannosyltransferase